MTLQDFAANETATLVRALLARRSDPVLTQLRALNEAVAGLERAAAEPGDVDEEVRGLATRLNKAFAHAAERIQAEGRTALEEVRSDLESKLADGRADLGKARASLDAALARIAALEAALDAEREGTAALEAALAAAQEDRDRAEDERRRTEDDLARATAHETTLEAELRDARATLDETFADVARLGADLEATAAGKGALTTELAQARGELQTALAQRDAVAAQLKASLARARMFGSPAPDAGDPPSDSSSVSAPAAGIAPIHPVASPGSAPAAASADGGAAALAEAIDGAVRAVEELTAASSAADLLGRLGRQLSKAFCRVALFRVQGNRLQGEHQIGFDYTTEVRKIAMPLGVDSLLTRVVSTGEMERLSAEDLADESKGAPFRGSPTVALALPVVLRGETIAVAYLDNWNQSAGAAQDAPESGVVFARLVVRQAGALFIGLAHEIRMLTELRDYAAMLLKGAEQMYAADVDARMGSDALRSRLEDNLACARQLFANRAAHEGPAAAALLDEQIEAAIEADPSAPFARELAAIRVREHDARRPAEAS